MLCCLVAMACGPRSKGAQDSAADPNATSSGTSPSKVAAVFIMSLEFQDAGTAPPTTHIDLVETNENGANKRNSLGVFEGQCKDVTVDVRKTDPQVLLAFHCQPSANQRGVLVHIIARNSRLVLLRAWLGSSKPTFDEFDQIAELPPYPTGVPIKTEYDN